VVVLGAQFRNGLCPGVKVSAKDVDMKLVYVSHALRTNTLTDDPIFMGEHSAFTAFAQNFPNSPVRHELVLEKGIFVILSWIARIQVARRRAEVGWGVFRSE
jgi:hypothetical protein